MSRISIQLVAAVTMIYAACPLFGAGTPASEDSFRFTYRPPQVHDQATQAMNFGLDLSIAVRKNEQLIQAADRRIQQTQRRTVTVLETDEKRVLSALLHFHESERSISDGVQPAPSSKQAVAGKTYLVQLKGEELMITYQAGGIPSPEELAVVQQVMETLGRPNPLGLFFHQRTVKRGERLRIPNHLANDLLGFNDAVGDVTGFELTLRDVRLRDGHRCAVLDTRIDAASPLGSNLTMRMQGQLWLELDTCRALAAEFTGPVALSDLQNSPDGPLTVRGKGQLKVAISAHYGRAKR